MSDSRNQPNRARGRRRPAAPASPGARILGVLLLLACAGLFVALDATRSVEARLAEWSIGTFLHTGTRLTGSGTSLLVGLGGTRAFTLEIGIACSAVLLLAPFFALAAFLLLSGRATILRAIPALLLGAAALLTINAIRLLLIAALTLQEGLEGFGWAHTVYGSAIVLVGLIGVIVLFLAMMARGRRTAPGLTP